VSTLALAAGARAQTAPGFALDRYNPAERGSDWFANESLDLRGHGRFAVGLVGDWAHRPLVLYSSDGSFPIVKDQLFAHLGANVILWNRLRVGASFPVLLWGGGEATQVGATRFADKSGTNAGDLRLGTDVRILGEYGGAFTLAGGLQVHLPTGSRDSYASDGKVRVQPRILAAGDVGPVAYAANVAFTYRALTDRVAGQPFGSEMYFSAAAGVRLLDKKLLVGPEIFGSTVVSEGGAFEKLTTPFELIFSAKGRATPYLLVGLGVGPGLTRGQGSPGFRLLGSVEWFPVPAAPPEPPTDRDGDGVLDTDDACIDVPGRKSADALENGCPEPKDRDKDGVLDKDDACPDEPGKRNVDLLKNGCPPRDRDKDGVLDDDDACPDEPGLERDEPDKNGCPLRDRDKDGVIDEVDACPDEPGKRNDDPKKNGCPEVVVKGDQILVMGRIEFETRKDQIRSESEPILDGVLKVIKANPDITKLSVEGHTDNRGGKDFNKGLSKRRAAAVVKWLVSHGVDKKVLSSAGFGQDKPIADNGTDEGRQNNRRVEFHIVERKGKK
jgi:outer membrane protein OmpA-like peptidoglycan-associated protein